MPEYWGTDNQGKEVFLFSLKNSNGMEVRISNYGALIKNIIVPSESSGLIDTVLSYPRLEQYLKDQHFIGAVCGRYCNRIANGEISLNNSLHKLQQNDGAHTLHGGEFGFYNRTWEVDEVSEDSVTLSLTSEHGDQGFPGQLSVFVKYTLREDNALIFSWSAHSTEDTVVGLTNHSYFNLAGFGEINNHQLQIHCENYTPLDNDGIPGGEVFIVGRQMQHTIGRATRSQLFFFHLYIQRKTSP